MATSAQPTRDDFAALLDASLGKNQSFEGRVVRGIVTALENEFVVIDVGLKSEGRVPLREFADADGKAELNVGDEVEVFVDRVENSMGVVSKSQGSGELASKHLLSEPAIVAGIAKAALAAG